MGKGLPKYLNRIAEIGSFFYFMIPSKFLLTTASPSSDQSLPTFDITTFSPNSGSTCSSYSEVVNELDCSLCGEYEDEDSDENIFNEAPSVVLYTKYYFPKQPKSILKT